MKRSRCIIHSTHACLSLPTQAKQSYQPPCADARFGSAPQRVYVGWWPLPGVGAVIHRRPRDGLAHHEHGAGWRRTCPSVAAGRRHRVWQSLVRADEQDPPRGRWLPWQSAGAQLAPPSPTTCCKGLNGDPWQWRRIVRRRPRSSPHSCAPLVCLRGVPALWSALSTPTNVSFFVGCGRLLDL